MKPGLVATFRQFSAAVSIKGLIAVAVWGASFVATRMALATLNPLGLVAARLLMGAALLALVIRARGGRLWPVRRDVPACVFLGVILSVHLLMQAYGLRYTTAIQTGWIIGFIPVTIALGAWLTRQQRLSALGWSGVALGTAGVLIVTLAKSQDFALAHWGNLLQVASCLTWTVYTLTATGPNARNGVLCVTTFGMAVAAGIAALATIWTGVWSGPPTAASLGALVFLGLICSGVAYYLWFAAQRDHGPARIGSLLYVEPFVALLTGALLLHEPVTLHAVFGGLCVLAGVWLVARGARQ